MIPSDTNQGGMNLESQTSEDVLYLSAADERANTITHGVGFLLSLAACLYFAGLTSASELGLRVACWLFTISMAVVYLFSTLSHAVMQPSRREALRAWDQGTIYFLIAGTYSPFIWQGSPVGWRTVVFTGVWIAAIAGFVSKVALGHRINAISTATYILLGWIPAMILWKQTPLVCFQWMLFGGICYTGGIFFLKKSQQWRYSHAAWHIAVICGSACHSYAIWHLMQLAN
jgi:hemolysin III